MFGGEMRVLEVFGDSADLGRGHGSACAEMIRAYADDRIGLSAQEDWSGGRANRDLILSCADETLEHHEQFSESRGQFNTTTASACELGLQARFHRRLYRYLGLMPPRAALVQFAAET